jgi:hypothetical protein
VAVTKKRVEELPGFEQVNWVIMRYQRLLRHGPDDLQRKERYE